MRCATCGRRLATGEPCAAGCPATIAPPEPEADAAPSLAGYEIEGVLGAGGFGTVFAARRLSDGARAAIKIARAGQPLAAAVLDNERAALRMAAPPTVPAVLEHGEIERRPYVVLERLEMPSLAALPCPMEPVRASAIVVAMLDAVGALHAAGLIHADLKPDNVFVAGDGRVTLIDLGLSRIADRPPVDSGDTTLFGTPEYMAPEQCEPGREIGAAADLYACGVILYELLVGRPPFVGTAAEVRGGHRLLRPPLPSTIAPVAATIEQVVMRCLAKDPAARWSDSAELRFALERAGRDPTRPAPRIRATSPPPTAIARARTSVPLVYFTSAKPAPAIAAALTVLGADLAHAGAGRYVAAIPPDSGEKLAERARQLGERLVRDAVCDAAMVDIVAVLVRKDKAGARRYIAPFERDDRWPRASDPRGVLVADACAHVVGAPTAPVRDGVRRVEADATVAEDLVGRAELVDELVAIVSARESAFAIVTGDVGVGKSALARAIHQRLAASGTRALLVRAAETGGALASLLEQLLGPVPESLEDMATWTRGLEHASVLGLAVALGRADVDLPELRPFAAAPGALRNLAARAAATIIEAAAPIAIVIDDAHVADEAALDAIELATAAERHARVAACAIGRASLTQVRPELGERAPVRRANELLPLDAAAAGVLCERLLRPAERVPTPAIARLVERTRGVPLLLVELVRGLKLQGLVRQQAKGGAWYVATDEIEGRSDLPLVEWIAARELEALPAPLAAHAKLVAALGNELVPAEILGVVEAVAVGELASVFPMDAAIGNQKLLDAEILVPRGGRIAFRNALVRDAFLAALPAEPRRALHAAALEYYKTATCLPELERIERAALHAAESGARDQARDGFRLLADRAQRRHVYLDAERWFGRALAQLQDSDVAELELRRGRALARYRLSRYEDALADFGRARELARAAGDSSSELEILLDEATALDWADEFRRSAELVQLALACTPRASSELVQARLSLGLGRSCFRVDDNAGAVVHLELAEQLAAHLGEAAYETRVIALLLLGLVYCNLGRVEQSERAFETVVPMCEVAGDSLHLGAAVGNRAMLWACVGKPRELVEDLRRLLAIARDLGNGRMEQQANLFLALFLHWLGEAAQAEGYARRAVDVDDRRFGSAARPEARLVLARVLAGKGDRDDARAVLAEIRARLERSTERELALLPSEEIWFACVDLQTREPAFDEWNALLDRGRAILGGNDLIELYDAYANAARTAGRPDRVRAALEEAVATSRRFPNVMRDRLERALEACG